MVERNRRCVDYDGVGSAEKGILLDVGHAGAVVMLSELGRVRLRVRVEVNYL